MLLTAHYLTSLTAAWRCSACPASGATVPVLLPPRRNDLTLHIQKLGQILNEDLYILCIYQGLIIDNRPPLLHLILIWIRASSAAFRIRHQYDPPRLCPASLDALRGEPALAATAELYYRGEVVLDHSNITSHPVTASDDPATPQLPPIPPSTELSAQTSVTLSEPELEPELAGNQASTAPANIEPSPDSHARPSSPPPQVLGRRRRSFSPDSPSSSGLGLGDLFNTVENENTHERAKKRRRGDTMTMMNEGDMSELSNGNKTSHSNGSTSQHGGSSAGVTNGHKLGVTLNGSSNRGENNGTTTITQRPTTYFGHNREEVTRILIQALSDMGYETAAKLVSQQSGHELESPTVAGFRSAVLEGSWPVAEQLLTGASYEAAGEGNGLVLAPGSDRNAMRFWIRQQKYLELLEQRDTTRALMVLRGELSPLSHDTPKLHFLSGLLMCQSTKEIMSQADWDGVNGESRRRLLSELSKCISPSVMLPENRLVVLLQQVKQNQIESCLYHTEAMSPSLYSDHYCERRNFPSEPAIDLGGQGGEIWQVQFSHDGKKLAASGSDERVMLWDTTTWNPILDLPDHKSGVGNFAWSPDDSMIVTCSQDRQARIWDVMTGNMLRALPPFDEPVSGCVWAADGSSFVLGNLGRRCSLCTVIFQTGEIQDWGKKHRVQDLCGSPDGRWLVAVDDQNTIHVYNAITRELEYDMELKARPTSVSISSNSQHLLVNKQDGEAQLINLSSRKLVQKYFGHKGGDYLIRSAFGGANEAFVTSGSEDGNVMIWHKNSGTAVERLSCHGQRSNSVSWNPADPLVLASGGDDGKIQIWTSKTKVAEIRSR
ncbi:Fc.00g052180.m01.CDS01 [Cosmosporella sp. VM-42]